MNNLVSIILVLASIGLFFGYIDPTYMDIKDLRVKKADFDRTLSNSEDLQREEEKLLKKFNELPEQEVKKLSKLIPDNIDNVRLIIDIDDIAQNHGMRIRDFETSTGEKSESIGQTISDFGTLTLSFSTTGTYNTFLAFLRDLERSLRVMDITSISFVAEEDSELYDYDVSLKTYWLK